MANPTPISPEAALTRLQNLCARQEKCRSDVRRKLRQWGVEADDAARVEQKLVNEKFVDDARYARAFVREKAKFSHWGAIKIRTALQSKSIAAPTIAEAMQEIDEAAQPDILERQLQKKLRSIVAKSPQDLRAKLLRFGLSRGFAYEQVERAVSNITTERRH